MIKENWGIPFGHSELINRRNPDNGMAINGVIPATHVEPACCFFNISSYIVHITNQLSLKKTVLKKLLKNHSPSKISVKRCLKYKDKMVLIIASETTFQHIPNKLLNKTQSNNVMNIK